MAPNYDEDSATARANPALILVIAQTWT